MVERNTPMATKRKKSQGLDAEAAGWDIDKEGKRLKNEIMQIIAVQGSTANGRQHPLFGNRYKNFKCHIPIISTRKQVQPK